MKFQRKIGWQKYEDALTSQLDSPLVDAIVNRLPEIDDGLYDDLSEELKTAQQDVVLPVDDKFMENIYLASNFDCWMGHTNFNITKDVMDKLNKMEGVEILKICSRYRFFMGVGRMFDFNQVRQDIEDVFLEEQKNVEKRTESTGE